MTQDEKDLLLKDLCARLPYEIKADKYTIRMDGEFVPIANIEIVTAKDILARNECPGYTIKPYLFPMSSMTEEQNIEYLRTCRGGNADVPTRASFDWCDKNHFDYRGLIPMGLAIDATGKNIY
jgi:hypothetical protein